MKSHYVAVLVTLLVLLGIVIVGLATAKWLAGVHCLDIPEHLETKVCFDGAMSPNEARKKIFDPDAALLCVVVPRTMSKRKTLAKAKPKWHWVEGMQCIDDERNPGNMRCNNGMEPKVARELGFDPSAECCTDPK